MSPLSYNQITDYVKGPVSEEITLNEVKEYCKVSTSSDDALLTALITAGREVCENYCNRAFGEREMIAWIDNHNGNTFLPFGPITDITKVSDVDGNEITDYTTKGTAFVQIIDPRRILKVEYTAGQALDDIFRIAIKSQILFMYENRGDAQLDTLQGTSPIAQVILNPFKRV